MKYVKLSISFLMITCFFTINSTCNGQSSIEHKKREIYSYKTGDINGIGKWYKGREIAHVMGYQGISWLERTEREEEENTSILLKNMNLRDGDTIADIGAGSGYHVFKMAPIVGNGLIYAVDIQPEMLEAIQSKKDNGQFNNITLVKGTERTINLPEDSVDKVLMVDVYHEFNFPLEMMLSVHKAMRNDAQLFLIEYKGEDPSIPIKKIHKMTEAQAIKEMKAAGFKLKENIANLPWQHCMVFMKD